MITIELQSQFNSLARTDHLQRMNLLLTSLDLDQTFSRKADFTESLSDAVNRLEEHGVTNAYFQSCVLLCLFAGEVSMQTLSSDLDPRTQVLRAIQQALHAGLSEGAFQHLFDSMAGLGRFDQPWPCGQSQANLLDLLPAMHMTGPIQIQCDQAGLLGHGGSLLSARSVNLFRTESGFVHQVFGQFTPEFLITRVCRDALSEDGLIIHVDPVFERCEIGRQDGSGFQAVQKIELIDTRPARLEFKQLGVSCTAEEEQRLHSNWLGSALHSDSVVELSNPWLQTDLSFLAQWAIEQGSPEFVMNVDMQLRLAADALKWQANFRHNNLFLSVCIRAEQDTLISWQHRETKLPGQLPLGQPLWLAKHRVPLHVYLNGVVGAGGPIVRVASPMAGELVFILSVVVNPVDRKLEVVLTVDHSELVCNWQSVDPVMGWTSGCWELAPPAKILQRCLSHG